MLLVAGCLSRVACCLFGAWCVLVAAECLLRVGCCLVFAVVVLVFGVWCVCACSAVRVVCCV